VREDSSEAPSRVPREPSGTPTEERNGSSAEVPDLREDGYTRGLLKELRALPPLLAPPELRCAPSAPPHSGTPFMALLENFVSRVSIITPIDKNEFYNE